MLFYYHKNHKKRAHIHIIIINSYYISIIIFNTNIIIINIIVTKISY